MTIRPPAGGAVIMVAWIGLLCLIMVLAAMNERDPRGLLLVPILLVWLVPVALLQRLRLFAAGDVLTYRGAFRTRAWRREQIERFAIVQSCWRPTVGHVEMRTLDGQCVTFFVATASRRREARLQEWLAALEDWRRDASALHHG